MQYITLKCKICAIQDGLYTSIVFEDLNRELTDELKYIYCVKLPNWQYSDTLQINDVGYLQCQYVEAGKTEWYNSSTKQYDVYKYSNCYFINFIKIKDTLTNTKEFDF